MGAVVYQIKNLKNQKLYIGKTNDPKSRWQKHLLSALYNDGFLIHKAINKYGSENFEFSIIEECESDELALEREVYWIAFYKTNICKYGNDAGYNLTDGGEGASGHKHSEESKKKMSDAKIGIPFTEEHKLALSIGGTGKVLSEEHKRKISESEIGKQASPETKKLISLAKTGIKNPQAKLTEHDVKFIKWLFINSDVHSSKVANMYDVAPRTIRDIKNNITWKHIISE